MTLFPATLPIASVLVAVLVTHSGIHRCVVESGSGREPTEAQNSLLATAGKEEQGSINPIEQRLRRPWQEIKPGVYKTFDVDRNEDVLVRRVGTQEMEVHRRVSETGFNRVPRFYEGFRLTGPNYQTKYVEMEYVKGQSLHNYLRNHPGPLPRPIVASVMYQLSFAVSVFHALDFAHGDLNAENVLIAEKRLDGNLFVKICDFGVSDDFRETEHNELAISKDVCGLGSLLEQLLSGELRSEDWEKIPTDLERVDTGNEQWNVETKKLLARIREVCNETAIGEVTVGEILANSFIKSGEQLAKEWDFYDEKKKDE